MLCPALPFKTGTRVAHVLPGGMRRTRPRHSDPVLTNEGFPSVETCAGSSINLKDLRGARTSAFTCRIAKITRENPAVSSTNADKNLSTSDMDTRLAYLAF